MIQNRAIIQRSVIEVLIHMTSSYDWKKTFPATHLIQMRFLPQVSLNENHKKFHKPSLFYKRESSQETIYHTLSSLVGTFWHLFKWFVLWLFKLFLNSNSKYYRSYRLCHFPGHFFLHKIVHKIYYISHTNLAYLSQTWLLVLWSYKTVSASE